MDGTLPCDQLLGAQQARGSYLKLSFAKQRAFGVACQLGGPLSKACTSASALLPTVASANNAYRPFLYALVVASCGLSASVWAGSHRQTSCPACRISRMWVAPRPFDWLAAIAHPEIGNERRASCFCAAQLAIALPLRACSPARLCTPDPPNPWAALARVFSAMACRLTVSECRWKTPFGASKPRR